MDKSSPKLNVLCALSASLLCASVAWAGTTWDGGGGDDNFGTGNNWDDDNAPSVGTTVDLTFSGSTRLTPFNNYTAFDDFRSFFFNSSSDFTVGGNEVDFFGKIENNGTGSATLDLIDFRFNSSNSELNPVSGDLTIGSSGTSGQQIFNNGNDVDVWGDNGHTLTLHTAIDGSGKFIVQQNSTVVISEGQTYTGNTEINAGEILIDSGGDISGSSSIFVGNGATTGVAAGLKITDTDGGTTFDNAITINNGDGTSGNRVLGSDNTSGRNTFDGNITMNGTTTLETASGGEVEFGGVLSGANGVKTAGDGTVVFTGANTYTGATDVEDGTLKLETGGSISDSSAVNVSSGATLDLNGINDTVDSLSLASGGTVDMGSGQLIVNNASGTWAGNLVAESGGSLVKKGSGTVSITGDNTGLASGSDLYLVEGTTGLNHNNAAGSADIQLGETSGTDAATVDISVAGVDIDNAITVRSGSSGTKTINAALGSGTATFSGAVTMNDDLTLSANSGGTLEMDGAIDNNGNTLTVDNAGSVNLDGVISDTGALTKNGAGTLTLGGTVANTYSGGTIINDGVLSLGTGGGADTTHQDALGSGAVTVNSGGELRLWNNNIGSLSLDNAFTLDGGVIHGQDGLNTLSGAITLSAGGGTLSGKWNNKALTASGDISGAGALTIDQLHAGNGAVVVLSGNNTYTGDTDVNNGRVQAGSTTAFGNNSAVTVASGAVLELDGNSNSIGSLAGAGTVENANATAATLTAGGDNSSTSFSGLIQDGTGGGALSLTKTGSGTLTLNSTAANTYSGGTIINDGVLSLGTGGGADTTHQDALGSGAVTVNSGGELRLWNNNIGSLSLDNAFTLDGGVIHGQDGLNTLSGAITLSAGGGTLSGKWNNKALTVSGTISGTGALTIDQLHGGNGAVVQLSGNNTYTGDTTVNAGTLEIGGAGVLQSGNYAGNISNSGTFDYNSTAAQTLSGIISGAGTLVKDNTGTLTLSGVNTYTGNTEIDEGEIHIASTGDISGSSSIFVGNGSTTGVAAGLKITDTDGGTTFDNAMTINNGDGTSGNRVVGSDNTSGRNTFDGDITLNATTTLEAVAGGEVEYGGVLTGASGIKTLGNGTNLFTGANTYTGDTLVEAGTLKLDTGGSISDSSAVSVSSGARFDLNGQSDTVASLALVSGGEVDTGAGQLIVNNASGTWAGNLVAESGGSLVKKGAGTVSITGDNTGLASGSDLYLVEGTTGLNHNNAAGSSTINLGEVSGSASATLDSSTAGVNISNDITVRSGSSGTKTIQAAVGAGTVTFSGGVTMNDALTLTANSGGTLEMDGAIANGGNTLTATGAGINQVDGIVSGSGSLLKQGSGDLNLTAVNTFTGDVFIDEGKLILSNTSGDALDAGFINIGSDSPNSDTEATLELGNGAGNVTLDQAIVVRADADATDNDINAFIVSTDNDNTISGNIAMDGELSINAANAAGSLTLDGSTLELKSQRLLVTGPGDVVINNTMSSTDTSGDLLKQGTGTVTLNAGNTFSGDVFIDEGTVAVTAADPLASSAINMGALSGSANTTFHLNNAGAAIAVDQDINVRDTGGSKTVHVTGAGHALNGSIDLGGDFADDGGDLTLQVDADSDVTIDGSGKTLNLWNETLTIQGAGDVNIGSNVDFKDEIGAGGDIDMDGTGTLTVDGTHASFGGLINVNEGTVDLQGALDNADGANVNDGGTLKGDGSISLNTGTLTVNDGGTLSPGNSVGTINAGDTVFAAGGSYFWEITDFEDGIVANNGAVDAGVDWDLLAVTGTLDLNSLTTANPFVIDIASLVSAAGANGPANNFVGGSNYIFNIATATGGILTDSLDLVGNDINDYFTISQANFYNDRRPGIFAVQITGGALQLRHFAHVPEPSTTVLFGLGGIILFRARRRRKLTLS